MLQVNNLTAQLMQNVFKSKQAQSIQGQIYLDANLQSENFKQNSTPSDNSSSATPYLIGIIIGTLIVILGIVCICIACKKRRQRHIQNRNFMINPKNRYIKVNGQIVGKNVGPRPIVINTARNPQKYANTQRSQRKINENNRMNHHRAPPISKRNPNINNVNQRNQGPNQVVFHNPMINNQSLSNQRPVVIQQPAPNVHQINMLPPPGPAKYPVINREVHNNENNSQNDINPYGFS